MSALSELEYAKALAACSGPELEPLADQFPEACAQLDTPWERAAPTLVWDALVAAHAGSSALALRRGSGLQGSTSSRPNYRDAFDLMRRLAEALEQVAGRGRTARHARFRAAKEFLSAWFVGAPPAPARERLDWDRRAAVHDSDTRRASSTPPPWAAWRIAEEQALRSGGSPAFRQALAELLAAASTSVPQGYGVTDEHTRRAPPRSGGHRRGFPIESKRRGGVEPEPFRTPQGVFSEVSPTSVEAGLSRLVPEDLALFAGGPPALRALRAVRLADASFRARLGAEPRPARRRPRLLLVATLCDSLGMHAQGPGCGHPDIDALRLALFEALPRCMSAFVATGCDFTVEVRRDAALPLPQCRFTIVDAAGPGATLSQSYQTLASLVSAAELKCPNMFVDAPSRSPRLPPPCLDGFDAGYLLAVGDRPSWCQGAHWSGIVDARWEPSNASVRVSGQQAMVRPIRTFGSASWQAIADSIVDCIGAPEPGDAAGPPAGIVPLVEFA